MGSKATKSKRAALPQPPDGMEPDALLEFNRIVRKLDAEGRAETADEAVIAVTAETWAAFQLSLAKLREEGVTTVYSNGNPGVTASLKAMKELGRLLRGFYRDLGFVPDARGKIDPDDEDLDLD